MGHAKPSELDKALKKLKFPKPKQAKKHHRYQQFVENVGLIMTEIPRSRNEIGNKLYGNIAGQLKVNSVFLDQVKACNKGYDEWVQEIKRRHSDQ